MDASEPSRYPADLPRPWGEADRWILRITEAAVFVVGISFTAMLALEVVSRYVFDLSLFFINAIARFLLVWFFLLGAGLALRQGAHVGLELVVSRLPPRLAWGMFIFTQAFILVFFLQMVWSGYHALGPAMGQFESSLGVTLVWVMLAFPVGFALLIYHQAALFVTAMRSRHI